MTENIWYIAAIWMGLAFIASLISIRLGISVALIEILVGVIVGNIHFHGGQHILQTTDWTNFLAMLGSGVLTFLAGAEIDPVSLRANLRASLTIGIVSFLLPFIAVWLFAQFVLGWPLHQAQIAGIALSTTSVAVVYAVMIEGGLGQTPLGKTILAACFITDFGTVLALGTLFANFNIWLLVFVVVTAVMLWYMPKWTQFIITRLGASRVSEPEVKFIFLVLFFLGGLASTAKSEAVLPAYLVGLVVAGVFLARQDAGSPDAEHRVHDFHAVLFHQGRAVRFAARAVGIARTHRGFAVDKNGHEIRRRLAVHEGFLHAQPRGELHDAAHVHRPDVRHDFRFVRPAKQNH